MKLCIEVIILSIFCVELIHSEGHNDRCAIESQHLQLLQTECMNAIYHQGDLSLSASQTLFEHHGSNDVFRRFTQHYCPVLSRIVDCLSLGLNVSDECRIPLYYESDIIHFRILGVMLHWACDNDAEILVQVLQDGGLHTFMFSSEFNKCAQILSEVAVYIRYDATTYVINPEYCLSLGRTLACYNDLVKSHKNQNLIPLAGNLHDRIRDLWGC